MSRIGRRGIPFVVSAPSGTGKTTVCRGVVERDSQIRFSVSHTTRPRRSGEREGVDYHFVDRADFERMVQEGAFVEHAEYAGNLYGTSFGAIDAPLEQGSDLLLEVDVQGALQLRQRRRDARFIFLLPPSRAELERRLRNRGTDSEDDVARRLAAMADEFRAASTFDYAIVNEEVERSVAALLEVIRAERTGAVEAVRARYGRAAVLERMAPELGLAG